MANGEELESTQDPQIEKGPVTDSSEPKNASTETTTNTDLLAADNNLETDSETTDIETASNLTIEETDAPPLIKKRLGEPVLVADRLPERLRRPEDLFEVLACLVGIAIVILLGIYAHSTTQGVAEDVRSALGSIIKQVLFLPLSVIEGLFVIVAPVAIIVSLAQKKRYQSIIEVVVTAAVSAIIGWGISIGLPYLPPAIVDSLMVTTQNGNVLSIDVVIMVLAAVLTVAGDSSRMRSVKFSWYGIWFLLIVGVIRGTATVPGMIITVLLGRILGCLARWLLGFDDRRALPADLVKATLDMGLVPVRIVRCDLPTDITPLDTWEVHETDSVPDYATGLVNPPLNTTPVEVEPASYEVTTQLSNFADRHYQVWTKDNSRYDMHVLDPGRAITGTLGDLWNSLRLRGISRWISPTVKANAERAMLTASTAATAGVITADPVGISEAGDSVVLAWQPLPPVVTLLDMTLGNVEIPDAVLSQAWSRLLDAHSRGVSHRNLDINTLVVDASHTLWILDWDQGEVATSEINRHIDRAQMLAHLSLVVGPERAIESARQYFSISELVATAMVLQTAVLPPVVRARLKKTEIIDQLRTALAMDAPTPGKTVEPIKLQRFAPKTVLMFAVGVFAVIAVMGSLNFNDVVAAVKDANPWWILAAFLIGATTWVGAAIPLVAFSPVKIRLWDTTLAQVAASIATVVAPAGIGPAALNLRFLTKQKMKVPVALATVTLVQISQFLTSVTLLLIIVVVTGTSLSIAIPTMTIIWVAAAIAAIVASLLAIPKIRNWVWGKAKPTWEQIYPQFLWVLGHPKELGIAFLGNLIGNIGYIGSFAAALAAFGYTLSPLSVTTTYLVSNTLGSVIPAPGGIGPVELALTSGLQVAGIPAAVALSTAVLYRLVTFYGRIPFGWFAMRAMQKKDLI